MITGQNPEIAFFWRWLARLRAGADYAVDQVVRPVVDVADVWPKSPKLRTVAGAEAGAVMFTILWGPTDWTLTNAASPSHGMLHRLYVQTVIAAGTPVPYSLELFDIGTLQSIPIFIGSIGGPAAADNVFTFPDSVKNTYLPTGWNLVLTIAGAALAPGDVMDVRMEYSHGPQEQPLPRDI